MSARLLYAHFPAATHPSALEWMRVVAEIAAGRPGVGPFLTGQDVLPPAPAVAWRLVSENRREIARGCRLFADEAAARADLAVLLRDAAAFEIHTNPAPRLRSTGWFVSSGGALVMMGARRYEKRSAAESAAVLAVRLMRELAAVGEPVLARPEPTDPLILR